MRCTTATPSRLLFCLFAQTACIDSESYEGIECSPLCECPADYLCGADRTCTHRTHALQPGFELCVQTPRREDGVTPDGGMVADATIAPEGSILDTSSDPNPPASEFDPCTGNGGCHPHAACTPVNDGRVCTCLEGFLGDGFSCGPMPGLLPGLRMELPCLLATAADACSVSNPAPKEVVLQGTPGVTYNVKLQIRGVVEPKYYEGGVRMFSDYFRAGGGPGNADGVFNIYELHTTEPDRNYYLNAQIMTPRQCFGIDYTVEIPVTAGAKVTLSADVIDARQIKNLGASQRPIVIEDVPPSPDSFNGQFIQIDVQSVTPSP